jgi:tRNA (cmo5U34)-methyltransferase
MDVEKNFQSLQAVQHYQRTADILIPGRQDILSKMAQLTASCGDDNPKVLDLGCGYGDATTSVLSVRPNAIAYLIDNSDEMIRLATEHFKNNQKVTVIKYDLNQGLPPSLINEKFDVVVSCLALHHIEYENRTNLYRAILVVLSKGGMFISGDRFKSDSSVIDRWEFDNWISWMVERIKDKLHKEKTFNEIKQTQIESDRKLGDKPGTIFEISQVLIQSGFLHVDCIWKNLNFAIMVASK